MATSYKTKVGTIGDVTVTVSKAGKSAAERLQALLEAIGTDIENGLPEGGSGEHPDQGLPGGGAHPDQGLPSGGARPDQGLPPSGSTKPESPAGRPDQSLPLEDLAEFLKDEAKEIAAEVLKGTLCDPAKPK